MDRAGFVKASATLVARLVVAAALAGSIACATVNPAERILGDWQTDLNGFPVQLSIDAASVRVAGQAPVAYTLEGDTLKLASDEHSSIQVRFPSRGEMLQTNLSTGEVQRYTRLGK